MAAFGSALILFSTEGLADYGIRINAKGTFTDVGLWMYRTASGTFRNGDGVKGTNESLIMPDAQLMPGETVVGIMHIHHERETMGYPLHISLIEKAFANIHQVNFFSSNGGQIWRYESGTTFATEVPVTASAAKASQTNYKLSGPFHGNGAMPPDYQDAISLLKAALNAIDNLPPAQEDLTNYVVLFAETNDAIWMEIDPNPAPDETVHLGCQMRNGRDMVFSYEKKAPPNKRGGPWLQCI